MFADLKKDGREVLAYFAVIVGAGLSSLALAVAILYARRHGNAWHNRIPVVFVEKLDTEALESKIYQIAVVVILVLLPLYGVGKSIFVANEGLVCEQADKSTPAVSYEPGKWMMIFLPPHTSQIRLMQHDTPKSICRKSGVEIGSYTPILFAGLPVVALILLAWWLVLLFGPAALARAPSCAGRGRNQGS